MNLVIKLFVIIYSIFIFNVKSAEIPHHCCSNDGVIQNSRKCQDGSDVSLSCDEGSLIILDPTRSSYQAFSLGTDNEEQKAYLDAYVSGYHVYQPHFCTGPIIYSYANRSSPSVAITCSSGRQWYKDKNVSGTDSVQTAKFYRVYAILGFVFNFASALFLLTTAAIYYALPSIRDTQGTCYFYFTLIAGIGHSVITYIELFNTDGILPNMCITNLYLAVYCILCGMSWSTVTCYNIWRTSMNYQSDDEEKLLKRYKMFGFGLPFGLIFCAWAFVHIAHIANLTLDVECSSHQQIVYGFFVSFPVLILVLLNSIMFIHSQIRIWSMHTMQSQDRKLNIKILKYRLFMNAKLFFIMGVPWAISMLVYVIETTIYFENNSVMTIIQLIVALLVLSEGIPIFLILVVFRKRVLRGVGNTWFANSSFYPDKWKTVRGSETEEEVSDDETPPKTPEAKFTAKTEEENMNGLDDLTIVIL